MGYRVTDTCRNGKVLKHSLTAYNGKMLALN